MVEAQKNGSPGEPNSEATKQMLLKVIELNPEMASAHANLGRWYAQQGAWQQAVECYQEAIRLQPDNASIYRSLERAQKGVEKQNKKNQDYSTVQNQSVTIVRNEGESTNTNSQIQVSPLPPESPEASWLRFNENNEKLIEQIKRVNINLVQHSFSIIIPVYNPPVDCLKACVESVLAQTYRNYNVILVDDCSTDQQVQIYLKRIASHDRVQVQWREENGHISRATNDGASISASKYLVFVDNDDLLEPHALATVNLYINRYQSDILYSDEMRTDAEGKKLYGVKFKPGYSPELLLGFCYFSHLVVIKREIFNKLGGFRVGYEGSQDHDLWLRATEITDRVTHIPQKLYVRRVIPGSTAAGGDQKSYAYSAAQKALQEAFQRRGVECSIVRPDWAVKNGYGIYHPVFPHDGPAVHIVVVTTLEPNVFKLLLESLNKTLYKNFKVTFMCNGINENIFKERKKDLIDKKNLNFEYYVKYHNNQGDFNYSELNNIAANEVKEELILFLNDDIEFTRASWLSQMVGWIQLPGVCAVGLKLIYPNKKSVQHCGIAHGLNFGTVGTVFRHSPVEHRGHQYQASVTRNVSASTAACLLVKSVAFKCVGGFDITNFPVTYSDVDLCYRLNDTTGERIVQCNEVTAIHHESATRPKGRDPVAIANYKKYYGDRIERYLNPCTNFVRRDLVPSNNIISENKEQENLRVILISHNLNNEGAPISLLHLALYLVEQHSDCCSVSVWSPVAGPLQTEYEHAGIPVLIGLEGSPIEDFIEEVNRYSDTIKKQEAVFSYIKKNTQCNTIIANTILNFWAINIAHNYKVPAIWIIRESEGIKRRFQKAESTTVVNNLFSAFRNAYKVVYVAKQTLEVYKQDIDHYNYEVIPNGLREANKFFMKGFEKRVQAKRKCGFRENDFVVCQVGTICERKNQIELVKAFITAKKTIHASELKLLLVGYRKGNQHSKDVMNFVEQQPESIQSCIEIVPELSNNVDKYYQCSDLFCFTSLMESYPRVLLEAMAAELPIISNRIMGAQAQISSGFNGIFYCAGNEYELALKIIDLFLNREKYEFYKNNSLFALKSLTNYKEMGEKYFNLLQSAVLYNP